MGTAHLTYFFTGIILILISLPLIKEKIKMNHWYGIRLPSTMRNERIWYAANKKGGIMMSQFGMIIMLLSFFFYFNEDLGKSFFTFIFMTVFILVGIIVIAVKSTSYANRLHIEEKQDPEE